MPKRPPSKYTAERALRVAEETIRAMELQADAEYCVEDLHFSLQQVLAGDASGTPFQDSWHIGCLTEHLQALVDRQIRRLIINVPPRSLKSTIVSVAFPAWRWLKAPHEKFLAASYGLALAKRDSRRCRNLIASQWYQARWASRYGLSSDQNEKGRFDNDRGGFRMIASVEGGVLGEGGSVIVMDDPNDLEKMNKEPDSYPQSVRDWYSGSMSSRNIDPKTDVRLCVQQRASYGGDLTEYLLEAGGMGACCHPERVERGNGHRTVGISGSADEDGGVDVSGAVGPGGDRYDQAGTEAALSGPVSAGAECRRQRAG